MAYVIKSPLIMPENNNSIIPSPGGTKGLFFKSDGLYTVDSDGSEKKVGYVDYSVYKFKGTVSSGEKLPTSPAVGDVYNIENKSYITVGVSCVYLTGKFSDYFNYVYTDNEGKDCYEFINNDVISEYNDYFNFYGETGSYGDTSIYNIEGNLAGSVPYAQATGYPLDVSMIGYTGNNSDIVSFFICKDYLADGFPVINVNAGENVAWTGSTWDRFGGYVDLSAYPTKTEMNDALALKTNETDVQEKLNLKANIKTNGGGFLAGDNSTAEDSAVSIGRQANSRNGGASIGFQANANGGGAIGSGTNASDYGGAIGLNAKAGAGFSGGKDAKAANQSGYNAKYIDCIQLGSGTNNNERTLQVYDFQLLDKDGKIPNERLLFTNVWGGVVSNREDVPISPAPGTYCYVSENTLNGVKYTGKLSDMFQIEYEETLMISGLSFRPSDECIKPAQQGDNCSGYVNIYTSEGSFFATMQYEPLTYPGAVDAHGLGAETINDTVTFYLGIYDGEKFPEKVDLLFSAGEMIFWTGDKWIRIPSIE